MKAMAEAATATTELVTATNAGVMVVVVVVTEWGLVPVVTNQEDKNIAGRAISTRILVLLDLVAEG